MFDYNSALVCEGVIGDGCGGGRVFYIKDATLFAHDPTTNKDFLLLKNLQNAISLEKKGCLLFIGFLEKELCFDLSKMSII